MSFARVTQRSMSTSIMRGLEDNLSRAQLLQQQLSSGKRVSQPSDDPSATGAAMKLRSQNQADTQYLRNITDASGRLATSDDALTQISDRIRRVRDLVVTAGDAALGSSSLDAVAAEIGGIRNEIIDLYNTRWLGRPVFGGTVAGSIAVDPSGTYVGNDQPLLSRISRDATMRVDVQGSTAGAATLPAAIAQAMTDVTGNTANLPTDLNNLDSQLTMVLTALGDVGARAARLDTTQANIQREQLDFQSRISENEDVDLPLTITNLQSQQVAYQAALGAASKVLQVSLVDFLK